jgi:hypothetical protein
MANKKLVQRTFSVRRFLEHGTQPIREGLTLPEAMSFAEGLATSGPGTIGVMDDATNTTIQEFDRRGSEEGRGGATEPDEEHYRG